MNKQTRKAIVKQLEKHRVAIGRERDALRDMQEEISVLFESCEMGVEALDTAIQTFSELA